MIGRLGLPELILILGIALVVFGPSKLPQIGQSLGDAVGQFKKHVNKISEDVEIDTDDSKKKSE